MTLTSNTNSTVQKLSPAKTASMANKKIGCSKAQIQHPATATATETATTVEAAKGKRLFVRNDGTVL
jgi:hypothetical protein